MSPTLNECINRIENLVVEKDFTRDIFFFKLVWAFVEVAEAIDLVKKGGLPDVTRQDIEEEVFSAEEEHVTKLAVEIVDFVFYACDAYRLLRRKYPWLDDMDEQFLKKMEKNMGRPKRYGANMIAGFIDDMVEHYVAEGLEDELIEHFLKSMINRSPKHRDAVLGFTPKEDTTKNSEKESAE